MEGYCYAVVEETMINGHSVSTDVVSIHRTRENARAKADNMMVDYGDGYQMDEVWYLVTEIDGHHYVDYIIHIEEVPLEWER